MTTSESVDNVQISLIIKRNANSITMTLLLAIQLQMAIACCSFLIHQKQPYRMDYTLENVMDILFLNNVTFNMISNTFNNLLTNFLQNCLRLCFTIVIFSIISQWYTRIYEALYQEPQVQEANQRLEGLRRSARSVKNRTKLLKVVISQRIRKKLTGTVKYIHFIFIFS